jgi:hypothetical protein
MLMTIYGEIQRGTDYDLDTYGEAYISRKSGKLYVRMRPSATIGSDHYLSVDDHYTYTIPNDDMRMAMNREVTPDFDLIDEHICAVANHPGGFEG